MEGWLQAVVAPTTYVSSIFQAAQGAETLAERGWGSTTLGG